MASLSLNIKCKNSKLKSTNRFVSGASVYKIKNIVFIFSFCLKMQVILKIVQFLDGLCFSGYKFSFFVCHVLRQRSGLGRGGKGIQPPCTDW